MLVAVQGEVVVTGHQLLIAKKTKTIKKSILRTFSLHKHKF